MFKLMGTILILVMILVLAIMVGMLIIASDKKRREGSLVVPQSIHDTMKFELGPGEHVFLNLQARGLLDRWVINADNIGDENGKRARQIFTSSTWRRSPDSEDLVVWNPPILGPKYHPFTIYQADSNGAGFTATVYALVAGKDISGGIHLKNVFEVPVSFSITRIVAMMR